VKGPVPESLPDQLIRHLRLHRRIDAYTQRSPAFQASRSRLDPGFRYARSILVDVFYDHFLAQQWERFSVIPLTEFTRQVYQGLQQCVIYLPLPLQQQLPHMMENDWLYSYRRPEIVERVLGRLEARLKYRFPLAEGYRELARLRAELESDFAAFMTEIEPLTVVWKKEF
jgi:acyl carrier protein phosphodiesterase